MRAAKEGKTLLAALVLLAVTVPATASIPPLAEAFEHQTSNLVLRALEERELPIQERPQASRSFHLSESPSFRTPTRFRLFTLPKTRVRGFRILVESERQAFEGFSWETGVGSIQNRYYDPEMGRFLTTDPMGYVDGPSMYQYGGNDPFNKTDPEGLALYAFDGTWNNRGKSNTNVWKLRNAYGGNFWYEPGVGTKWYSKLPCGISGCGGKLRIRKMLKKAEEFWNTGDKEIDIIGFSRGAAEAREFANVLYREGIESDSGVVVKGNQLRIRFMGLFDTVGSFGVPGNDIDIGYNFSIPPNVERVRHATAANEYRTTFPLMRLQNPACGTDPRFIEMEFKGAHSDVGGGYKDDNLSKGPLNWMWSEMYAAGLPMVQLSLEDRSMKGPMRVNTPHKKWYYRASKKNGELVRKEFYPPGCPN